MEERHLSCRRTGETNLIKFCREPVPLKSEYIVNIIQHLLKKKKKDLVSQMTADKARSSQKQYSIWLF